MLINFKIGIYEPLTWEHLNFEENQEFNAFRQQATGNRQQGKEVWL
ncbi:MAG: hypothetical protein SXA11_24110 [Cyanobacteriota bacterium]|nr:hypothetical protein [Cyanobacteriota bacterium]